MVGRRLRRIPGALAWRARAAFERLIARTPTGRTEFFDPAQFPWIPGVEARADEIKEELDGLLSRVDQLPNFQDIQEEQRMLTQDDRWKVFLFYGYGVPCRWQLPTLSAHRRDRRIDPGNDDGDVLGAAPAQAHPASCRTVEGCAALSPRRAHAAPMKQSPASASAAVRSTGGQGRSLVFDDTFDHEAWNDSDEIRVVLFVDVIRKLPWYLAVPNRAFIGAIRHSPFIKRALANNEAWQETLGATITAA